MKFLNSLSLLIVLGLLFTNCQKDDDLYSSDLPVMASFTSFSSPKELYSLIQEEDPALFVNAGTPELDCYLEKSYPDGSTIYTLAFMDEAGSVKNALVTIHLPSDQWRYRLINKKYYEWKYNNSPYATNRYYYAGQLNTIARLQMHIDSGCDNAIQTRCDDIIMCANQFLAFIDCETGALTITESPGCLGPSGQNGGYNVSTVYMGGSIWWSAGSGEGESNGEGGGFDPWSDENWNSNEDNGVSHIPAENGGSGGGVSENYCAGGSPAELQISDFDYIEAALADFVDEYNIDVTSPAELIIFLRSDCNPESSVGTCVQKGLVCSLVDMNVDLNPDLINNCDAVSPNTLLEVHNLLEVNSDYNCLANQYLGGDCGPHLAQSFADFVNTYTDTGLSCSCLGDTPADSCVPCLVQLDNFQEKYNIELTESERSTIFSNIDAATGTNSICDNQQTFEEWVYSTWEEEHNEGWFTRPLDANHIWELAGDVKNQLLFDYPDKAGLINQLFPCRVLGPALENAVLESLGRDNFLSTNSNQLLPGLTSRPDGYHKGRIRGEASDGYIHTITEVKGVFSTAENPIFDYSNQMGQFTNYVTWLGNNQYQEIGPNVFYLVLPAGVSISEDLITTATNANLQFIVSRLEQNIINTNEVRVSKPVHRNINETVFNPNLYCEWCARLWPINGLYGPFGQFDYDTVNLMDKINEAAAAFEASHLVNNNPSQDCPED